MQLKWHHRFVPFSNDTAPGNNNPLDRSNTSSPMAQPGLPKPLLQPSPTPAASSPSMHPLGPQRIPTPPQLVSASCAKCHATIGTLINSWSQITNSYYTQTQPSYRAVGLQTKGDLKPPGAVHSILGGCLIQTLICINCREVLGFLCVQAPDHKSIFRNRQFLKLVKLILVSQTTKAQVTPHVEKPLDDTRSGDTTLEGTPHLVRTETSSPQSPGLDHEEFRDADMVAVRGTNDGTQTWREAHEVWYSRTNQTLSPGAFGKRILKLGGGMRPKPAASSHAPPPPPPPPPMQHSHSGSSMGHRPSPHIAHLPPVTHAMPPNSLPPLQAAISRPLPLHQDRSFPNLIDDPRRDIERIDAAVGRLQSIVDGLSGSIEALRQEVRMRPTAGGVATEDQSAIDLLSETVSTLTSKSGEVDGIKLQMESLKRRVKRVEEMTGGGPLTPSHTHNSDVFHRPANTEQRYESPFPILPAPAQPTAANGIKRPVGPQFVEPPEAKRSRPEAYMVDQHNHSPTPYVAQPQYMPITNGEPREVLSASQRPLDNNLQYTPRRGPGRPRKYPTPEAGINGPAPWEQEGWIPDVDADGFYRPLAPTPGSDSSERGRIIRRGTLGGALHIDSKRTRQRPIRNSDGVLIRKDGKPDMRSVSSAQNLKRFYDKKMAEKNTSGGPELEMHHTGSNSHSNSPAGGRSPMHRSFGGDPTIVNLDSDDQEMYADDDSARGYSRRTSDQDHHDHDHDHEHDRHHDHDHIHGRHHHYDDRYHDRERGQPNHHDGYIHHRDSGASVNSDQSEHKPFVTAQKHTLPPLQAQTEPPTQSQQRNHETVMSKMFPRGMNGERTRLDDTAAALFEPARSTAPLARMQTREDIVKKEVIEVSGINTPVEEPAPSDANAVKDTPVEKHIMGAAVNSNDKPAVTLSTTSSTIPSLMVPDTQQQRPAPEPAPAQAQAPATVSAPVPTPAPTSASASATVSTPAPALAPAPTSAPVATAVASG